MKHRNNHLKLLNNIKEIQQKDGLEMDCIWVIWKKSARRFSSLWQIACKLAYWCHYPILWSMIKSKFDFLVVNSNKYFKKTPIQAPSKGVKVLFSAIPMVFLNPLYL